MVKQKWEGCTPYHTANPCHLQGLRSWKSTSQWISCRKHVAHDTVLWGNVFYPFA